MGGEDGAMKKPCLLRTNGFMGCYDVCRAAAPKTQLSPCPNMKETLTG